MWLFVAVITPPVTKRHIAFDTDATLNEAAQFLAQKANSKRAPLPPKRTSSFRDQVIPMPQPRSSVSSHLSPGVADDAAAAAAGGIMATSMTDSIDLSIATGADSLSDHQNRSIQSSSDDLLSSTPASQSRNGSLERILEHSVPAADGLQSAGCSSGEQKTPDTDASDASLPPPPPSLLVDVSSGVNTLPRFSRVTAGHQHQHGGVIADQNVLNQLRQSLKKTTSRPRKAAPTSSCEVVDDNFDSGHSSPKAGFFSDQTPRVSGYSTVPRSSGTASASFINSLERSTKSACASADVEQRESTNAAAKTETSLAPMSDVLHMPTPEVRRKVEEWQAGVERSLRASDDHSWKLKPSKWNKRSSYQEADMLSAERTSADNSLHDRLSSDSSTLHEQSVEEHNVKPSAILRVSAPNVFVAAEKTQVTDSASPATDKPEKSRWKLSKTRVDNKSSKNLSTDAKPVERHASDSTVPKSETLSGTKQNADSSEDSQKVGVVALRDSDAKSSGKSRKGNAVQSMFLSSDSPFHGAANVSAKKSDPGKKPESSSGDASPGVRVKNKLAKVEPAKPNLPPGAKPVLPVFKPQLHSPTQQVVSSPQQLVAQSSVLHRSGGPADKEATGDDVDCTKENVLSLARSLSSRLSQLKPKSTPSTSLQPLSDDVQLFHRVCSGYVESLPPHAKFQFREILATLEKIADGLRASGGRDQDQLLVTLQNSVRSIEEAARKK